jgi:thioredoxin 1
MPVAPRHWVGFIVCLAVARAATADDVLLGRVRPESILSISDEWRANRDAYEPFDSDVRRIASLQVHATLDVYFGSWCSDSRREVPRLLKVLDRASPRHLRVRLFGLDRTKKEPVRLAKRGAIERVPTFILLAGGREVGRIVETPQASLEHDLAVLVERAASSAP